MNTGCFKHALLLLILTAGISGCKNKPVVDDGLNPGKEELPASIIYADDEIVRRPVPATGFIRSNALDDLIYDDDGYGDEDPETVFSKLPPTAPVVSNSDFLNATLQGAQFATAEKIRVTHPEFSDALRVNIRTVPELPYSAQLVVGEGLSGKAQANDILLVSVWMRTVSGGHTESQTGQLQLIIEETGENGIFNKLLVQNIHAKSEWTKFYFPVRFVAGYTRLSVRLGYYIQTVEIGGYEIRNYGKSVSLQDLPTTATYLEGSLKNAEWRTQAFERIEKIRKGDFKIMVRDANGDVIPGANVELNMYEHEFQFGTAIPQYRSVLSDGDPRFSEAVRKYFNGAVLENNHKWAVYEADPARTRAMVDAVKRLGIKYFRGHALVWDRNHRPGITMPPFNLLEEYNNRTDVNECIRKHIFRIAGEYKGELVDWDVLNEPVVNSVIVDVYGKSLINDWFNWARLADPNAKLYINEYIETQSLFNFFDEMVRNRVAFDGIGIQSHFMAPADPASLYHFYQRLAKYGKRLKITEYDFATDDVTAQASFMRDFMIVMFSHELMDGFYGWGFHNEGPGTRGSFFDSNWNEKPGLAQYTDLVYNKWWTNASGKTNANGIFSVRGFYGDYDVTVSAGGKTKKLAAALHKGYNNTITVILTNQ